MQNTLRTCQGAFQNSTKYLDRQKTLYQSTIYDFTSLEQKKGKNHLFNFTTKITDYNEVSCSTSFCLV